VRILCDTHIFCSLSFLPALVRTHLNLFRTYTIYFVPLIQGFPGFYIRLGLRTINIFSNQYPGTRITQLFHLSRYTSTLKSSEITLFFNALSTFSFLSHLLRFTPVISHKKCNRCRYKFFFHIFHYLSL
jgi:hypothetical protein